MREEWHRSPHEVDPLSWFTGPVVPLVFAALACGYGLVTILTELETTPRAWLQLVALCSCVAACSLVFVMTRPQLGPFTPRRTLVPLAFGWAGLLLSALGYVDAEIRIEHWWTSLIAAFALASLTPYTSAYRMLWIGGSTTLVTAAAGALAFSDQVGVWPLASRLVIAAAPPLIATVGGVVFQLQCVLRVLRWAARRSRSPISSQLLGESVRLRLLRSELTGIRMRVAPVLERVAASGQVTEADRAEAAVLARALREELVERSNRSWLDSIARGRRMTVVDPENLADLMTPYQRAALHGLVRAVLDDPSLDRPQLMIELRDEGDGSVAVAMSIDVHLPEGRRVTLLAPHYLTLKTAVNDLSWQGGDRIRLRFRVSPDD